MSGSLWYKRQTASQSMYYTMRCLGHKTFLMRPDLRDVDAFQGEFVYPLEILRDAVPFVALQPSSTVLHVGFDRTYFDKGMSHPLIETAIVGEGGMVRCIDPDRRNVDALNSYAESHGLGQLSARQGAVWSHTEDLAFVFDRNWGPLSGTPAIPEQRRYALSQSGNSSETVRARPIDEIVPELFGDRSLDFLALTVNGAEAEALDGARKTLAYTTRLRISMALAYEHFSFRIRKQVCNQMMSEGWSVVVSNAPHDPWRPNLFLWSCMVRESAELMERLGAVPVTWEQVIELAADESSLASRRADQIRRHQGSRSDDPSGTAVPRER